MSSRKHYNRISQFSKKNSILSKSKIRLIGVDGGQIGIMEPREALSIAKEKGLELMEVAPNADPPVCRMVDYGKYKYRQSKREKAIKQNQKTKTKEIKLRPAIAEHDFQFKKRNAESFLLSDARLKLTIMFRGRQRAYPELGKDLLNRMSDELSDFGEIISPPKMEGYNMSMMMGPKTD